MIDILFATRNKGKFIEFKKYFENITQNFNVISLNEILCDIPDCEETGLTFEENAIIKVKHTRKYIPSKYSESIIIADDSGMEIDVLNGKPGVHTRRWIGREMSDKEIINYCLKQLSTSHQRSASYVSCFAISINNNIKIIEDESRGIILKDNYEPSSLPGMPFRSLFYVPELEMMFHKTRELNKTDRKGYRIGHDEAMKKIADYLIPKNN